MTDVTTMQVPAHIAARMAARKAGAPAPSIMSAVNSGGITFPRISTRASRFRLVEDDVETVVGPEMDVIIVGANPKISRTFYEGAYVPGENKAPDCASDNGEVPNPGVPKAQHANCAACPKNVLGSKTTPTGAKAKLCNEIRNLAVVPAADPSKVYGLAVTVTAMKSLREYFKDLSNYGIEVQEVVTTLSFDDKADYPKVVFKQKPGVFVPEKALPMVEQLMASEEVKIATRQIANPAAPALAAPAPAAPAITAAPAAPVQAPPPAYDPAAKAAADSIAAQAAADAQAKAAAADAAAKAAAATAAAATAAAQAAQTQAAPAPAAAPTAETSTPAAPLPAVEAKLAALFDM